MPPSPAAMVFTGWNEKAAASDRAQPPTMRPAASAPPSAWQASSTIAAPADLATAARGSMAQIRPPRWTGKTALGRPPAAAMAAARVSAVSRPVAGSTSAKATSAPQKRTAVAVDRKLIAGTMHRSRGPTSSAASARCSAAVPLEQAAAARAPTAAARADSNSPTFGPWASRSLRNTATTAAMSDSSIQCWPYGNGARGPVDCAAFSARLMAASLPRGGSEVVTRRRQEMISPSPRAMDRQ